MFLNNNVGLFPVFQDSENKKDTTTQRRERESEAMKTKTQKMLPKTANEIFNGGVYEQRVRCGKGNCKCAKGEHHTAFYFLTRRAGKLVKYYVPKMQVETFTEMVKCAAAERRRRAQAFKAAADLLVKFRAELSGNVALINDLRGHQDYE